MLTMFMPVKKEEWQYLDTLDKQHNIAEGQKIRRKDFSELNHSFVKLCGTFYAYDHGAYLGKGAYGKVKVFANQAGETFAGKITYPEGDLKGMPFPENLFKYFGFVKHVDTLNAYEQQVLVDLNLVVAQTFFNGSGKHLTIMPNLGIPLKTYLKQHPASSAQAQQYCLDVCKKMYDFHIGADDKNCQKRLHNDIKAANVLINPATCEISIIDFGEAFSIDIGEYSPHKKGKLQQLQCRTFQHPRPTSFEPDLAAPEIQNQIGSWYTPWLRYGHARRFYSFASDIYLLASVLKPISDSHPLVSKLYHLMQHPDPKRRIDLPTAMIALWGTSESGKVAYDTWLVEMQANAADLISFDSYKSLSSAQMKTVACLVLASDKHKPLYCQATVSKALANKAFIELSQQLLPMLLNKDALSGYQQKQLAASIPYHVLDNQLDQPFAVSAKQYLSQQKNSTWNYYFNWWHHHWDELSMLETRLDSPSQIDASTGLANTAVA